MKGQNLRIAVKDGSTKTYIAGALSFNLEMQADTEENTTKDSTGSWKQYEVTTKGWSGSGQATFTESGATGETSMNLFDMVGTEVTLAFDITEGSLNQTTKTALMEGSAIITSWKVDSSNAQRVTVDFAFQGNGQLAKASA